VGHGWVKKKPEILFEFPLIFRNLAEVSKIAQGDLGRNLT
jgi:hypothetical protein